MWYVEPLSKTYNAVDRTFYDAIKITGLAKSAITGAVRRGPAPSSRRDLIV